ncbi:MAG: DDE-type integrase/transposase/recombinase [Rubrivivax sp.]|nr:DDE-type integrase/transposase/recombinase [Rubrivivax sp.]
MHASVGRRHIATLVQRIGIQALAPQPGTGKRAPGHPIYPYLLRKLAVKPSNQVWALDTTDIPKARGFVYLTAVVDVASHRVLAHKAANTPQACHAREVIEQSFARWGTPEIANTDQGSRTRPPSSQTRRSRRAASQTSGVISVLACPGAAGRCAL